jgi:ribosomal protein L22
MGLQLLKRRNDLKKYIQSIVPDTQQNLEKASLDIAKIWSSVGSSL